MHNSEKAYRHFVCILLAGTGFLVAAGISGFLHGENPLAFICGFMGAIFAIIGLIGSSFAVCNRRLPSSG